MNSPPVVGISVARAVALAPVWSPPSVFGSVSGTVTLNGAVVGIACCSTTSPASLANTSMLLVSLLPTHTAPNSTPAGFTPRPPGNDCPLMAMLRAVASASTLTCTAPSEPAGCIASAANASTMSLLEPMSSPVGLSTIVTPATVAGPSSVTLSIFAVAGP